MNNVSEYGTIIGSYEGGKEIWFHRKQEFCVINIKAL
jgi:hypothetical protein